MRACSGGWPRARASCRACLGGRELRQLKAQPPLAELAVDAAQAADVALAAQEALQEEEEASITTESTEDNSPLARAAAAALANAGDRPRRRSTTRRLGSRRRSGTSTTTEEAARSTGRVPREGRCATGYQVRSRSVHR